MPGSSNGKITEYTLHTEDILPDELRFRDLIDIGEATGIDPMRLADVMRGRVGSGADKLKALAAFVWIVERRKDKSLTYDDVINGKIKVVGEAPDPSALAAETKP